MKTWQKLKRDHSLWQKYLLRMKIIWAIRSFFHLKYFYEMETPLLTPAIIPESYLDVFSTNLLDRKGNKHKMFLTTSPEASLKKLLVAGVGNCFEITKSFRNKETGSLLHNPEFTILEWYRVEATYLDIMKDCEDLLIYIYKSINPSENQYRLKYQDKRIDLSPPWERISVAQAFKKYANISFTDIIEINRDNILFPTDKIAEIAKKKGYNINNNNTWEEIFHQIFLNEVEPFLGMHKPTIIYDYPKPLAALAEEKKEDPRFAERFEFYIAGLELGDCYTELTDPQEQRRRFLSELNNIKLLNKTAVVADRDFLKALEEGMPKCSGIAVGIDRLVMLFANAKTIQETLLFPTNEFFNV